MDINYQLPQIQRFPGWSEYTRLASLQALAPPPALSNSAMNAVNQQRLNLFKLYQTLQNKNLLLGQAVSSLTGQLSNQVSEGIFGTDTELGQAMGNLFSTGINTAGDQVVNNIFKGESLMNGMGQSVGSSLAGAGAGIAANYIGKGISSLGGNSKLSRGIGAGFATGLGNVGGKLLTTGSLGKINPYALGASVLGSGLQAAFGPSKEYGGKYGNITKTMDGIYDAATGVVSTLGPVGLMASSMMTLNKGLSNVFGSTSGMTRQDAILGSAFMPAPVKWLNMAGAKTTDKFRNQSWLNQERTNTFMQNGFGDLGEKFDKARRESGKTYGTFSRHAYNKAQGNVNFANDAFNKILDMADDEEIRRIRSEYMTSINNQRYAQDITGGFRPLYRGKEGMKIPEINHNFGQRLLSGAALIDNKQMILSAQSGNKIFATNSRGDSYYLSPSALTSDEVNVTVPETFITANPDDVARGNAQRWWKEHSNVHNEKGLKQVSPEFDLITLSPLLKPVVNRGFRWTFNKAGNLVRIQKDIPRKAENFYRAVNKDAIDDANKYGIIRGRQDREDNYAFFGRSSEPYHNTKYVIEGTPESADWISTYKYAYNKNPEIVYLQKTPDRDYSKAYNTIIGSPESNGFLRIGGYDSEFLEGYEALPSIKGQLNISPSSNFTYWKKYPIIGWRLHLFKNKVPVQKKKINLFLTSPYTGKWTLFGNREYRFKPGYAATNGVPVESRPLQITPKNAASITPEQWTAAQNAAIARGDMAEAQRLRDLHFKVSATNTQIIDKNGNPIHSYHGTGKHFNEFDTTGKYSTLDEGYYGVGAYFSPNRELAQMYADTERTPVMYDTYLNIKNPLRHVRDENADLYGKAIVDNDGVISTLPDDLVDETFDMTEYVATKPNQIKLADAVTYDNNGVRIPLGERDNFKINDIRYSWLPWFLGGSTAATLYNTNK